MPEDQLNLLRQALSWHFDQHDSDCLARLLIICMEKEMTAYEELDLICPDKDEHILTLFDERILIPVQSISGSSWEEKSLRLHPNESYFLTPVARSLIRFASWSGRLDNEQALTGALTIFPAFNAQDLVRLVTHSLAHTTSRRLEAGIMGAIARRLELNIDLHAAMDLFVAQGILSPCKGTTQASGLAWYEFNACLFWKQQNRT